MAYLKRYVVDVTTDASGDGTGYTEAACHGLLHAVCYVADGSNPFANTADVVVSAETSGAVALTATNVSGSATWLPRPPVQDEAAADALFAAGGTKLRDRLAIADERVKIVVAQGGNTKTGRFHVYVEGG